MKTQSIYQSYNADGL